MAATLTQTLAPASSVVLGRVAPRRGVEARRRMAVAALAIVLAGWFGALIPSLARIPVVDGRPAPLAAPKLIVTAAAPATAGSDLVATHEPGPHPDR